MNWRRLVLALGVVAFVVITAIIIFSIDWGGSDTQPRDAVRPVNISDYATTNVQVRMAVRGPINSNQEHQDLQITVGQNETIGELLDGYQGGVNRSTQTANNAVSYKAFLSALHNLGFTNRKLPPKGVQYDGACPTGNRYTFSFIGDDAHTPPSTWTTSCSAKLGTFAGQLSQVRNLFEDQLPSDQFQALTKNTSF